MDDSDKVTKRLNEIERRISEVLLIDAHDLFLDAWKEAGRPAADAERAWKSFELYHRAQVIKTFLRRFGHFFDALDEEAAKTAHAPRVAPSGSFDKFCPSCGAMWNGEAESCPSCGSFGTRNPDSDTAMRKVHYRKFPRKPEED